jgi:hypothetical protein
VHYLELSNFAWLKRPASASKLKLHELVALCTAALRPSRKAWEAFLKHLKQLEESGELSSDEVTAIVASSLTDQILVEEEIDEDSDADTLSEVVERVKQSYVNRQDAEVKAARDAAEVSEVSERQLRTRIENRARSISAVVSWAIAGVLGLSFVVGTIITTLSAVDGTKPGTVALVLAILPLAVAGLCSLLWGFHVKAWRRALQARIEQLLCGWLAGTG